MGDQSIGGQRPGAASPVDSEIERALALLNVELLPSSRRRTSVTRIAIVSGPGALLALRSLDSVAHLTLTPRSDGTVVVTGTDTHVAYVAERIGKANGKGFSGVAKRRAARAVGTSGEDPATSLISTKPQLDPLPDPQLDLFAAPAQVVEVSPDKVGDDAPPVVEAPAERAAKADDFSLADMDIGKGGLAQKYRDNIRAIRILKAMQDEGRKAIPDERRAIARYVGWGALKGVFDPDNKHWAHEHAELRELLTDKEWSAARASTLNAHYTSPAVIEAMYEALDRAGFVSGRVLEPSVGVGNFFGMMPAEMRKGSDLHGVELDPLTSRIAAALYPSAKVVNKGFQDYDVPAEYFDLVVGNPPFGSEPIVDMARSAYSGRSIHNYFISKSIDKLRPGGLLAMVVTHRFMDAQDDAVRKWIGQRADLVSAVRLPNTAFKEHAGTEVVADILIFRKRAQDEQAVDADWLRTGLQTLTDPKTGEDVQHRVNTYFLNNPGHVLGTPAAAGKMYRFGEYTVLPSGELGEQLANWAGDAIPASIYTPVERAFEQEAADMAVPDGVKEGSYFVGEDGQIMMRGLDRMGARTATPWEAPNRTAVERMKGMIALRDSLREQMRMELLPNVGDEEIESHRTALNRRYDSFQQSFGYVHDAANYRLFVDDTEASLVLALEFDYDRGVSDAVAKRDGVQPRKASANKADILKQRVLYPPGDSIKVDSAKDALLSSLNYKGRLDLDYMAFVCPGKTADEILGELEDLVYHDPVNGLALADDYLSGDVKTKLEEAKAAAQDNPAYERNVSALEKVIPADKRPSEINATLGAAFIPKEIFEDFAVHVTGTRPRMGYIKGTGQWMVHWQDRGDPALTVGKWGIMDMPSTDIFSHTLAGRGVVVTETVRVGDKTQTIVKQQETAAAREKQQAIREEWKTWLWGDPARANLVAGVFNEKLNRTAPRKFDGSHMSLPGLSPVRKLLPHQKNSVWRALQGRQVLLDHVVGAGKTAAIVATMMEMRRLGIARKPLIAVPNHLTMQWQSEFYKFFPGARVLAATPDDFAKDKREKFFAKIVTGDWDAVVIGHSSLKKIGLPAETEKRVLNEQIAELADSIEEMKRERGDRHIIRDMERIKARLEAQMRQRQQRVGKRDKALTFDELGIDAFAIDELHEFKNLFYNSTMDKVPGMGNPSGSDRAFDLFVKTQWMWETFGDKAVLLGATGTPVSNSMVEMFNLQRYMQYPTLKSADLNVFDAWARQFSNAQSVYEVSPSGTGYRQSSRLEFSGINALMPLYKNFADTITLEQLVAQERDCGRTFPVPRIRGGQPQNVVAKRSPLVADFMGVPTLELAAGRPVFGFNPPAEQARVEPGTQNGATYWRAVVERPIENGGATVEILLGTGNTEAEARQIIVESALTPKITVDPESILGQFNRLRELTRETEGKVNALSLTGLANKAALDYRLIDPDAQDFPDSKINLAIDRMMDLYHEWHADKGAQLVFCDLSVPLSCRRRMASSEQRVYVRDSESDEIAARRGTLHTLKDFEEFPFFIVKEKGLCALYDAASGAFVGAAPTKAEAFEEAARQLNDPAARDVWMARREQYGDITQDAIDDYNAEHNIDVGADGEAVSIGDIVGVSGAHGYSVYDDIKQKLTERGVPANEIAFIHDYGTPAAKDKLFKAVNRGDIRFLMGSTPKMGAGTNVQERLVGLHHIDAPWRPSDLEQREGRIVRQGNKLYARDPEGFEVAVFRYATEQTYDTRRWQLLEHKARMIAQIKNYDGSIDSFGDIGAEAANAADMKAAASGDPLILEETKLRNEVNRLETLQDAHADEAQALARKASQHADYAERYGPVRLRMLQELQQVVEKHPAIKDVFPGVTVNGRRWGDRDQAVAAIQTAIAEVFVKQREAAFVFRGIEFSLNGERNPVALESPDGQLDCFRRDGELPSAAGFITRFGNYVGRLPGSIQRTTEDINKMAVTAAALYKEAKIPFTKTEEFRWPRRRRRPGRRRRRRHAVRWRGCRHHGWRSRERHALWRSRRRPPGRRAGRRLAGRRRGRRRLHLPGGGWTRCPLRFRGRRHAASARLRAGRRQFLPFGLSAYPYPRRRPDHAEKPLSQRPVPDRMDRVRRRQRPCPGRPAGTASGASHGRQRRCLLLRGERRGARGQWERHHSRRCRRRCAVRRSRERHPPGRRRP